MPSPGARIFFWGARALYVGEAFGLGPHRNAVAVLCAGVTQPFEVAVHPEEPSAGYVTHRVVLIPANTLHHLKIAAVPMAFLYVDAHSDDFTYLHKQAACRDERAAWGFGFEAAYISALTRLVAGEPWREIRAEIAKVLGLEKPVRRDERIAEVLRALRDDTSSPHTLSELARRACLSPSRFQHLFKEATGVAVRRYKLWNRMGCAVRAIAAGESLTEAALRSGFASSAHFSAAFGEMFGMCPSRLSRAPLSISEEVDVGGGGAAAASA